jgi:ornithine decarboxylase
LSFNYNSGELGKFIGLVNSSIEALWKRIVPNIQHIENNVYIFDIGVLERTFQLWKQTFPNILPHYAVKCNPHPAMIHTLGRLGANFDCASPAEITAVLKSGIQPNRIIYAHPCKKIRDLKFAQEMNVPYTVFDNIDELQKIATHAPTMPCLLRISAYDPNAQCILGNKYGAPKEIWESLLIAAANKHIQVVGISFHVGSGASSPSAYREAIANARQVFEMGRRLGLPMTKLDIGGGFTCIRNQGMDPTMAQIIQESLVEYFPKEFGVDIWAEPGRFFAEHPWTLFTRVIGKREIEQQPQLFLTCGLYGMFNNVVYDHAKVVPWIPPTDKVTYPTTLFGPTCDGIDLITKDTPLPKMELGEWIAWPSMGAYTYAGACDFNGIRATRPYFLTVKSQKD